MLLVGAHVSVAGGVSKAPKRGAALGCTAIQIFTKNQRQWRSPELAVSEIEQFFPEMEKHRIQSACVHDSYLINLGSNEPELLVKSRAAFQDEIERAALLKIPYLIFHPGSYKDGDEATCLKTIAESIDTCIGKSGETSVKVLIETTAGQGTSVGYRFEHLAEIRDRVAFPENVGFCIDTSHIFAAGYDIRTEETYQQTMAEFDKIAGLAHLHVIHLNDSLKPLASRVDRHENIGLGLIGIVPFRLIMNDKRLKNVLKIIETPGGDEWYLKNLNLLKSLVSQKY